MTYDLYISGSLDAMEDPHHIIVPSVSEEDMLAVRKALMKYHDRHNIFKVDVVVRPCGDAEGQDRSNN